MNCPRCNTALGPDEHTCPECGGDVSAAGTVPMQNDTQIDPTPGESGQFAALHGQLQQAVGDRYEIQHMLGRGGMGAVFLARERKLDWFRVTVDTDSRIHARVDCLSCPSFEAGAFNELGDIEIVLYQDTQTGLPSAPEELPTVGTGSQFRAEFEDLSVTVAAGNYFLLIQNRFYTAVRELEFSLNVVPTGEPAETPDTP